MPQIGNLVTIKVTTLTNDMTVVTGPISSIGLIPNKPDAYWIQLAGLTSFFYSDEKGVEIKVID